MSVSRRDLLKLPVFALAGVGAVMDAVQAQSGEMPFDIAKRPMPSGADLDTLVPRRVGTFERPAFAKGQKPPVDEDLNVTYTSGKDTISFGFSMPETPADAHDAVTVARDEAKASKVDMRAAQYVVGRDPSYFKSADFIAWTRGRYFFYAKASSPQALESFMRQFPF